MRKLLWSDFKIICNAKLLSMQLETRDQVYYLTAYDGPITYRSSVERVAGADLTDFETNFLAKCNKAVTQKTTTGLTKISTFEPEGGAATIVSINFADKCSWYMGAVQVTNGALTNSGLVYSSAIAKTHWIDLEHGRLYDEDNILALSGNTYKVKVFVDGVEVLTGFTIDYEAGTITFEAEPSGTVTASYWYADKSWYRIRPKAGKVLSVKAAEVQFAQGTQLTSSFIFCPWFVDHPVYGTIEIPGQRIVYKNFKDFISACNEGQDLIPAIGDVTADVHVFPFNYARPKPIKYTDNVEIRVYCANHEAVSGPAKFATATFYVTIDDL